MQPDIRSYYKMLITQILSLIGTRMSGLAIGIWVFEDTGKATPLLLVSVFSILPIMLGGSFAGVLADRWNRKTLIVAGDAGQALPTFFLMLIFISGYFQIWHLYLAVTFQAIFTMLQEPAVLASTAMMVPESHRDQANTLRQLVGPTAGLVAPVLTGFLYAFLSVPGIMAIDLCTFIVAVAVIRTIPIPQPTQSAEGLASKGSMWMELKGGFAFLWRRSALLGLVLFCTFINFILNGALGLITPYVLTLTGDKALLGVLLGLLNLGMVIGGVGFGALAARLPAARVHSMFLGVIVLCMLTVLLGAARSPFTLGGILFLLLSTNPMANALFFSMLQSKTPPDMHGRVFAVVMQLAMFATPLAFLISGPLVDRVMEPAVGGPNWEIVAPWVGTRAGSGIGLLMMISGVLGLAVSLGVYALPAIRHLEQDLPDYSVESADDDPPMPINELSPLLENAQA